MLGALPFPCCPFVDRFDTLPCDVCGCGRVQKMMPIQCRLTIRIRGATGTFDTFDWSAERTKMPKAKDLGKATAAFRDLSVRGPHNMDYNPTRWP